MGLECPLRTPNAQSIIIGSNTIDPKNIKDYEELTRISIGNFPTSLSSIAPEDVTNYQKLADLAVSLDSKAIIGISPEAVNNYDSLAIKAVNDNANLFEYLDERYLSEEILKKLRRIHKDVDAKRKRIFKKEDIESSMYDEYGDELRILYDDVYDDEMFGMNGLEFIDIFSITVLLFALGFMIMTILKLK